MISPVFALRFLSATRIDSFEPNDRIRGGAPGVSIRTASVPANQHVREQQDKHRAGRIKQKARARRRRKRPAGPAAVSGPLFLSFSLESTGRQADIEAQQSAAERRVVGGGALALWHHQVRPG